MLNKYPSAEKCTPRILLISILAVVFSVFVSTAQVQAGEWFYLSNLVPPPNGMYNCPNTWFALFSNGLIVRNFSSRQFSQSIIPPPLGGSLAHSFVSKVEMEISFDGGVKFFPFTAYAENTMFLNHTSDIGLQEIYQTEMLQMDIIGGDLPPGVLIRESPVLASPGNTTIKSTAGGYWIDSFFDVFTEVSTDGGMSWWPCAQPGRLDLLVNPQTIPPMISQSELLPPPVANYVTPKMWQQVYEIGGISIIIKDVKHKLFTASVLPPPPGGTSTHTFDSQADFQVSFNGGPFTPMRAPATTTVKIMHTRDFLGRETYETEMLQLDIAGGQLPAGVRLRESPTLASKGGVSMVAGGGGGGGGGATISSFFDIFTEMSIDGGTSWWQPTTGPAHVEAKAITDAYLFPTSNLPPPEGEYLDNGGWAAFYQMGMGVVITNVHIDRFMQSFPPPLPGQTIVFSFGASVGMMISMDGGLTFSPATAPVNATMRMTSSQDSDSTRYFDTEMLQLDITGGSLPMGIMIRESPTRASLGRTSERVTGGGYQVESFFDIFTELSVDGGQSWYLTTLAPATIYLRSVPCRKCGDFDNDGTVETTDLEEFVSNWLWHEVIGEPANESDLNCDSRVNFKDFALLANHWLAGCP